MFQIPKESLEQFISYKIKIKTIAAKSCYLLGIGSLLNDTTGEKDDTAEPPAPVLRRSPRQLTVLNRLDRCSRQKIPEFVKSSKYLTPPGCYLGANKLDIIQLLSDRDLWHVLELIFTHIPASDLSAVVLVNSCWRRTLEARVRHDLRRSSFVLEKKLNQENLNLCDPPSRSSTRIAMQVQMRFFEDPGVFIFQSYTQRNNF